MSNTADGHDNVPSDTLSSIESTTSAHFCGFTADKMLLGCMAKVAGLGALHQAQDMLLRATWNQQCMNDPA